jgi:hypothetical protein
VAIDTNAKKLAVMEGDEWEPGLPLSPNYLGRGDRQTLLGGYPGVLWDSADAISFVDEVHVAGGVNGGTTPAMDTSEADFLVATIGDYAGGTFNSLTDSGGNTWTALTVRSDGANSRTRILYCVNPTVAVGHTFTVDGLANYPTLSVAAYIFTNTPTFDVESGSAGASPEATGEVTPTGANNLVVSCASHGETATPSVNSSMTLVYAKTWVNTSNMGGSLAYKIQTAATAINPEWTASGSTAVAVAVFKDVSAGNRIRFLTLLGVGGAAA